MWSEWKKEEIGGKKVERMNIVLDSLIYHDSVERFLEKDYSDVKKFSWQHKQQSWEQVKDNLFE